MVPLGLLRFGDRAEVVEVPDKPPCTWIEDMGFRVGKTVEMLNNEGWIPLLIRFMNQGSHWAVGWQ